MKAEDQGALSLRQIPLKLFRQFFVTGVERDGRGRLFAQTASGLWLVHSGGGAVRSSLSVTQIWPPINESAWFEDSLLRINCVFQQAGGRCEEHDCGFLRLGLSVYTPNMTFDHLKTPLMTIAEIMAELAAIVKAAAELEQRITDRPPAFCAMYIHLMPQAIPS